MDDQERREAAVNRLEAKRAFKGDLVGFVVINAILVAIWAFTGAGYFWPGWVIGGWGIALILHGWKVYHIDKPITEDEIRREMDANG
jgi:hypothetical protein